MSCLCGTASQNYQELAAGNLLVFSGFSIWKFYEKCLLKGMHEISPLYGNIILFNCTVMHPDVVVLVSTPSLQEAKRERYLYPLGIFPTVTLLLVLWILSVDLLHC